MKISKKRIKKHGNIYPKFMRQTKLFKCRHDYYISIDAVQDFKFQSSILK